MTLLGENFPRDFVQLVCQVSFLRVHNDSVMNRNGEVQELLKTLVVMIHILSYICHYFILLVTVLMSHQTILAKEKSSSDFVVVLL